MAARGEGAGHHPLLMTYEADAVLFDIDGTLVDSTPAVVRVWRTWGRRFGVDPDQILAISHGRRSEDVIARFLPLAQQAGALREFERIEDAETGGTALPGAAEALARLVPGQWAAVTSGRRDLMAARLSAAGLPVPAVLVTAEDVRAGKPDPEGYLRAAALLGVAAERCVVIEDAPAGVEAGNRAGAATIAVTTTHSPDSLTHATRVVGDLTQVEVQAHGTGLVLSVRRR